MTLPLILGGKKMVKFEIENLSNGQADSFIIRIEDKNGDDCYILVDGNREGIKSEGVNNTIVKISKLKRLDYIIITHVDNDHLGGILSLFGSYENDNPSIKKQMARTIIIYNSITTGLISYKQAQRFEKLIHGRRVINSYSLHYKNDTSFLRILSIRQRKILEKKEGCVYLTFLNPDKDGVKKVVNDYNMYINKLKKKENSELINENSIVFLLEYNDKAVLFTGDANISDIKKKLITFNSLSTINLIKIPHHGAKKNNLCLCDLAKKYTCREFILTVGNAWDKLHPDQAVIKTLYDEFSNNCKMYTEFDLSTIDTKYNGISDLVTKTIKII